MSTPRRRKAGATLRPWLTARVDCDEKRFIQLGNMACKMQVIYMHGARIDAKSTETVNPLLTKPQK